MRPSTATLGRTESVPVAHPTRVLLLGGDPIRLAAVRASLTKEFGSECAIATEGDVGLHTAAIDLIVASELESALAWRVRAHRDSARAPAIVVCGNATPASSIAAASWIACTKLDEL